MQYGSKSNDNYKKFFHKLAEMFSVKYEEVDEEAAAAYDLKD